MFRKSRNFFKTATMLFCLLAGIELFAQVSFLTRRDFEANDGPVAVATADFNQDEILDLAVVNAFSNDISILLGDGLGGFELIAEYYVGGDHPFHIITADFNGDGCLDLANSNRGLPFVQILLGDCRGRFSEVRNVRVSSENATLVAGDFNNDGTIDIASADIGIFDADHPERSNNKVSVLLGNGDGTFRAFRGFEVRLAPEGIVTGDFDGDGHLDLVTANLFSNTITVLFGDGDGNFEPGKEYVVGYRPSTVVVGYFNDDEHLDIAVLNEGWMVRPSSISLFFGDGEGGFSDPVNYQIDLPIPGTALRMIAADFNNDGNLDIAVAAGAAEDPSFLTILLGDGRGGLSQADTFDTGPLAAHLAAGDFNRDGKLDIVTTNKGVFEDSIDNAGNISVFTGDGFGNMGIFLALESEPTGVAAGDLDSDGYSDLVISNASGNRVDVLVGDGLGGFSRLGSVRVETGPTSIAIADFNNDQIPDIVVANSVSNSLSVLLGNGNATFQQAIHTPVEAEIPISLVAADFDCDGKQDVAVANLGSNNVKILYGNGDGTFTRSATLSGGNMNGPISLVNAHFNGTQGWGLAVANENSDGVSIFLANGCVAGSEFVEAPAVTLPAGAHPRWVSAGDFNNDRIVDLAVANTGLNTVSVFLGNGDGTFQHTGDLQAGTEPSSLAVADYDGDGHDDIAITNFGSNDVSIFLARGGGSFRQARGSPFFSGLGPISVVGGVLQSAKGAGRLDLVIINSASRALSLLLSDIEP